jgi:hypothetical protein
MGIADTKTTAAIMSMAARIQAMKANMLVR